MTSHVVELFWPALFFVAVIALSWLQIRPSMKKRLKRRIISARIIDGRIVQVYEVWKGKA